MNIVTAKGAALAVAMLVSLGAGIVHASDSVTVNVNATIIGVCKFFPNTAVTMDITNTGSGSNIDPSSATTATGNVAIVYRCSNGTTPTFTVPASATVTCGGCAGSPTMAPTMSSSNTGAGTGMGSGKDQTLTVTGQILQANFQNSPVGAYTGSMVVSVSP